MELEETYYDRTMNPHLIEALKTPKYSWIIPFVKQCPELDFQTGNNEKSEESWFSVYKGTGRILKISSSKKGKISISADKKYMDLYPNFFKESNEQNFVLYLKEIEECSDLKEYYISPSKGKKEGYYQTLIARHYTFQTSPDDEFIIVDKELVIGFSNEQFKSDWNEPIKNELEKLIHKFREQYTNKRLPKDIKNCYGEFDFLGLTWEGDLVIMELKQNDSQKTYLSPFQIGFYNMQLQKLLKENKSVFDNILKMVNQKIEMGLIVIPNNRKLPQHFSGRIRNYLIIGDESGLSKTTYERYRCARDIVVPDMIAYQCNADGSIIKNDSLNG